MTPVKGADGSIHLPAVVCCGCHFHASVVVRKTALAAGSKSQTVATYHLKPHSLPMTRQQLESMIPPQRMNPLGKVREVWDEIMSGCEDVDVQSPGPDDTDGQSPDAAASQCSVPAGNSDYDLLKAEYERCREQLAQTQQECAQLRAAASQSVPSTEEYRRLADVANSDHVPFSLTLNWVREVCEKANAPRVWCLFSSLVSRDGAEARKSEETFDSACALIFCVILRLHSERAVPRVVHALSTLVKTNSPAWASRLLHLMLLTYSRSHWHEVESSIVDDDAFFEHVRRTVLAAPSVDSADEAPLPVWQSCSVDDFHNYVRSGYSIRALKEDRNLMHDVTVVFLKFVRDKPAHPLRGVEGEQMLRDIHDYKTIMTGSPAQRAAGLVRDVILQPCTSLQLMSSYGSVVIKKTGGGEDLMRTPACILLQDMRERGNQEADVYHGSLSNLRSHLGDGVVLDVLPVGCSSYSNFFIAVTLTCTHSYGYLKEHVLLSPGDRPLQVYESLPFFCVCTMSFEQCLPRIPLTN